MTDSDSILRVFGYMFGVLAFAWGACVGSYLNVCIYRIPEGLSTVRPRSHCPNCKTLIPWHLNVPLAAFLLLRGRCRSCGVSISPRYFLVELLTAVLFLLALLKFPLSSAPPPLGLVPAEHWALLPVYWLIIGGLILGTFIDFAHMILPDRVTLGGIAFGLLLSLAIPSLQGTDSHVRALAASAFGAAMGWGLIWLVRNLGSLAFRQEAMGFGDVKLMGAVGAFLGWKAVLFNILVSSLAGSLVGIALVVLRRREMQGKIPYGPYIALAAVLWLFWGENLWALYMNLIAPSAFPPGR